MDVLVCAADTVNKLYHEVPDTMSHTIMRCGAQHSFAPIVVRNVVRSPVVGFINGPC